MPGPALASEIGEMRGKPTARATEAFRQSSASAGLLRPVLQSAYLPF
jgi:hypothetical protein